MKESCEGETFLVYLALSSAAERFANLAPNGSLDEQQLRRMAWDLWSPSR